MDLNFWTFVTSCMVVFQPVLLENWIAHEEFLCRKQLSSHSRTLFGKGTKNIVHRVSGKVYPFCLRQHYGIILNDIQLKQMKFKCFVWIWLSYIFSLKRSMYLYLIKVEKLFLFWFCPYIVTVVTDIYCLNFDASSLAH